MVSPRGFDNLDIKDRLTWNKGTGRLAWVASRGLLSGSGPNTSAAGYATEWRGLGMARDRVELHEAFTTLPQLSAVTQAPATDTYTTAAFLANQKANHFWEVLGTNAVSSDVTLGVEGGCVLATHGANNDSTIILPHLTAGQSPWTTLTWGTDRSTRCEATIVTGSSVASVMIWFGLKATNTPVGGTDDNQAYFLFDTGAAASATYWHTWSSNNGTDTETAVTSTAAGAPGAVAASTKYHLVIDIDSSRVARFYINGYLVPGATALKDTTDLIPYFGVKALTGAAKSATIYKLRAARNVGATG